MSNAKWDVDGTHSSVGFTVRHMVFAKVHGQFGKWTASVDLDESDFTKSSVKATIETASIHTNEEKRDGHLRSPDFFDVEKFPTMTFVSKHIAKDGDGFKVTGDLTIRDMTKEITLDTELGGRGKDPWGGERIGFSSSAKLNRKDFGLTWNQALEAGGVLVGETVELRIDVQLKKA